MPPSPLQLLLMVVLGVDVVVGAAGPQGDAAVPAPGRALFVPSFGPPSPPAQTPPAKGRVDGDRRRGAWDFVPSPRDPYLDALEGHAVQPAAPEDNALRVGWAGAAGLGAAHVHPAAAPEFNVHLHAPAAAADLHAPPAAPHWDHASAALAAAAAAAASPPPPPPPPLTAALPAALAVAPPPAPADAAALLPLPRAFHNPHTFHSVVNYGHINLHHGDHYEPHNNGKVPETDAAPIKQALPPGLRALKALDALGGPARDAAAAAGKASARPDAPTPAPAADPHAPSAAPDRDVEPLDATAAYPGDPDDRTEPPK